MKIILSILLLLFTTSLFAQNKHSELYNQIEMICKIALKAEVNDTLDIFGTKISSPISRIVLSHYPDVTMPLLVIDGIPYNNYLILNTIDYKSIVSIQILKPNASTSMYGSRAEIGLILLQTQGGYQKQFTKKKKRKSKSNN